VLVVVIPISLSQPTQQDAGFVPICELRRRRGWLLNRTPVNSETYKYYDPSQPAAIVFAVLYCLTCTVTIGQYVYYKSWFWFFAVLASLSQCSASACNPARSYNLLTFVIVEAIGYIFKAISAANQDNRRMI